MGKRTLHPNHNRGIPMKIEIPTTSYWHKLSNEEKREILSHPTAIAYYDHMLTAESDPFLLYKPLEFKIYSSHRTGFLRFIEEKSNEFQKQHNKHVEEEIKESLRKQLLADFGVSDV